MSTNSLLSPDKPAQTPTSDADYGVVVRVQRLDLAMGARCDAYAEVHPDATPYHQSAWLKAVETAYGHEAWVATAWRGDSLCGLLPMSAIRRPFGRGPMVSLPFCDLGGVVADHSRIARLLVSVAVTCAEEQGSGLLETRDAGQMLMPDDTDAEQPAKVSMICPLPESSEARLKSYKPKLRSQIRKAEKNGLTAAIRHDDEAIDAFYAVFATNMHRLGSPVHSRQWFKALKHCYGDRMLIGLVFADDAIVGAGIVLRLGDRACIPWASTLTEYNRLAPNMLLYWTLLEHLADNGCRTFDFGRSTPGEGTYRFKRQWGAEPRALRWRQYNRDGEIAPEDRGGPGMGARLRPIVEQLWQRLPLGMANWLGPNLRKYITL